MGGRLARERGSSRWRAAPPRSPRARPTIRPEAKGGSRSPAAAPAACTRSTAAGSPRCSSTSCPMRRPPRRPPPPPSTTCCWSRPGSRTSPSTLGDTAIDAVRGDEAFPRKEPLARSGPSIRTSPGRRQGRLGHRVDRGPEGQDGLRWRAQLRHGDHRAADDGGRRAGLGRGHHQARAGRPASPPRRSATARSTRSSGPGGIPTAAITDIPTTDDIRLLPTAEYQKGLRKVRRGLPGG